MACSLAEGAPAGGASGDDLPNAGMERQTILGMGPCHMASELTKYFNASKQVLATPRIVYVSRAPDAGKFGHRGFKLCPIFENVQGIGFWAVPQVLGERSSPRQQGLGKCRWTETSPLQGICHFIWKRTSFK